MDTFFIFGAKYLYILSILIALWWFFRLPKAERRPALIFGITSALLAFVVAKIASHLYVDPRPFTEGVRALIPHAPDNGFPSDHTLLASIIPAVIIFYNRRTAIVLWIAAIIVAVSRVYVGVHHPIDVEASVAIAVLSAYAMSKLLKMKVV